MIHVISHGAFGESVLITEPTADEAVFSIMEYEAAHPGALFGPIVPRCGNACHGAAGVYLHPRPPYPLRGGAP